MPAIAAAPGPGLLALWRRLQPLPGGRRAFDWLLARRVPYSGSIGARVLVLEPGYARLLLHDRHRLRNHLGSIHAVALANLGELTSGLALLTALPPAVRGIAVRLDSRYLAKARGSLVAECRCVVPVIDQPCELAVTGCVRDKDDDLVAEITTTWRLDRRLPQA